jgi:hypothetical protein
MRAVRLFRLLLILVAATSGLVAQEKNADDKAIKHPVEMKPFTLTLVDEAGKPVKDAKVTAEGLRCEELPGSWLEWPKQLAGNNQFESDETGKVHAQYPVKLGEPVLGMTINKIDFWIAHPDFVWGRVEFDPAMGKATHTLIEGCRTSFTCIDENGKAIEQFGVVIAGDGASAAWRLASGELRSSGIPNGSWQTMLVAPSDDGVHLFSGVLPARFAKGKDVTIRNAKLRPGMRLSGSLSDNVPRPIAGGKVIARCLPKPAGETHGADNPSIVWADEAIVKEDGSFEFVSLPRGGIVQLIAISNGWLTTGKENTFTIGKLVEINEDELADNHVANITLEMEPTGSLEVEVIGPDGKPLVGAEVSTWPNQKLHLGGSNIVGSSYPSVQAINAQITGLAPDENAWDQRADRYSAKTNEQGKVTLTEIPINDPEFFFVSFEGMQVKLEKDKKPKDAFDFGVPYVCESTEPQKKITVHMELTSEEGQ